MSDNPIVKSIYMGLRLMRVKHWSKSVFVLLGFLFNGQWAATYRESLAAALAFCFVSSGVYIYNDIKDISLDRKHPAKQKRPIAHGDISIFKAAGIMVALFFLSFIIAYNLSFQALFIILLYIVINFFYCHGLKHLPVLDVLCISSGFMLRIVMGTWAIGISPSFWIILCGTSLSLFLSLSKRKLEYQSHTLSGELYRPVLRFYNLKNLNISLFVTSIFCLFSYGAYVFLMSYASNSAQNLLLTIPFVLIGFMRYLYLMNVRKSCGCPVSIFFSDKISILNSLSLITVTVWILK